MNMRRLCAIFFRRNRADVLTMGMIVGGSNQSAGQTAAVSYLVAAMFLVEMKKRGKIA